MLTREKLYVCKHLLAFVTRRPAAGDYSSTHRRIIDAALETFAERGFIGSTTKEIARRAKVNEVTVFRLFKSKRALYAAVVGERSPLLAIKERVEPRPNETLDELLLSTIKTVLRMLRSNKQIYFVLMNDAWRNPKTRNVDYNVPVRRGIEFLSSFMSELMSARRLRMMDPEIAAKGLMGAVQFYFITTEMMSNGPPTPSEEERILRGFVSVFLDGMRGEPGG